jgi:hypothetical protein
MLNDLKKFFFERWPIFFFLGLLVVFYWDFLSGKSFIWEDLLYIGFPQMNYFVSNLASGHFPFWISGVRDGMPFYSDTGLGAFYPLNWLLALFAFGGKLSFLAYQWYLILHLALGGVFTYLFLKSNKLDSKASLVGAIVFTFSGYLSLHFIHISFIEVMIWLPLELLFVKKVFVERKIKTYLFLISAILMSFLPGSPQISLYSSLLLVFYWFYQFFIIEIEKGQAIPIMIRKLLLEIVKIAGVFSMVLVLGAVYIIPTAENWYYSSRQSFGFKEIADQSLPWNYLLHSFVPNFFGVWNGSGSGVPFWGFNKDTIEYATWHAGTWQYWEFGFYAGQIALIALVILLFNVKKFFQGKKEGLFFVFAAFLAFWFMLGRYGGLFNVLYYIMPGVSLFRTPARMASILDFCLAVLSAYFVHFALNKENSLSLEIKKPLIVLSVFYGILFICFLLFGNSIAPELLNDNVFGNSLAQFLMSLVLFVILSALLIFTAREKEMKRKEWLSWIIVGVIFVDLFLAFQHFHKGKTDPELYYSDRNSLLPQFESLKKQTGLFRFAQLRDGKISEEMVFPRNTAYIFQDLEVPEGYILYGLKDVMKFQSMRNEAAKMDIQNIGVAFNYDSMTQKSSLFIYTNSLPRMKFYSKVKVFERTEDVFSALENGSLDYKNEAAVLSQETVQFAFLQSTNKETTNSISKISYEKKSPEEYVIHYEVSSPGVLFISQSFYPGWKVADGKFNLIHVFGAFQGVVLPESGEGSFVLKFSPDSFKIGLWISAVSFLIFVVVLILALLKTKRHNLKKECD